MKECTPIVILTTILFVLKCYSSCIEVRALHSPINIYNVFLDDVINKLHINDAVHSVNVLQVLQNSNRTQFKFLLEIENRVSGYQRDYVAIKSEVYEEDQKEWHRVTKFLQTESVKDIEMLFGLDPTRGFPLNCQTLKEDFTNYFKDRDLFNGLISGNKIKGAQVSQEIDFFVQSEEDKGMVALLESENVRLEKEIDSLKQELDFLLMNKNSLIEEELNVLKLKILEENKLSMQDKDLTIESLRILLQKRKDSNEQTKQIYDARIEEIKKEGEEAVEAVRIQLEAEILKMKEDRESIIKEVDEAKDLIDELTKDIITFKIEQNDKDKEKERLEKAIEKLKKNAEAINEQNKSLKKQLKQLKTQKSESESYVEDDRQLLEEILAVEEERLNNKSTSEEMVVSEEEQLIQKIEKLFEEKEKEQEDSDIKPVRTEEGIYLSSLPKNYYNDLVKFLNRLGEVSDSKPLDINTLNMEELKLLELQMLAEKEKAIVQTRSANQRDITKEPEKIPNTNPFVFEDTDNPFRLTN